MLALALVAGLAATAEPPRRVEVGFRAPFLEPNQGARAPSAAVESIVWTASGEGVAAVRVWGLAGEARFNTAPGRGLVILTTVPTPPLPTDQPWNGWRHRHGYTYETARGYWWNSLEDDPPPMDARTGAFYDAHLKQVWERTVRDALTAALAEGTSAPRGKAPPLAIPVSVPWADGRPAGKTLARFRLRLWGAALSVELPIGPGRGRSWLADADGPARWELDQAEWRRRHGYGADHPDRARLDDLMLRCAAYWTEVTTHLFLKDLDVKLRS